MGFGNLKRSEGLECLNTFLLTKSYIEGFQPSKADAVVFDAVADAPDAKYLNVLRWYNHINSFGDERKRFPGEAKDVNSYGPLEVPTSATNGEKDEDSDDLFASDDDEEVEKRHAECIAIYNAKKAAKADKPIAKSMIILDVKPWDDETDMFALEAAVRSIQADGLLWGTSKLVPLVQNLKKLQITCVVEDDKVGTDFLEEEISKFEDYVQSVDIAAFNKL
ncbi:elongation factor 1 beta [Echinococcus multilocularis]|uniref:Elongation factor 1 beta n=1 Tax=Echinococcus multilocularis TaxID=6211 RepID=A0A068YBB9_ECHMU|nr:elongation factor 1 beta [Echinococcus multilocularis]